MQKEEAVVQAPIEMTPPGLPLPNGFNSGNDTAVGAGQNATGIWPSNRMEKLKRHIAEIDTRAPKFGPQQIDLESTPSKKSPEDGESQGNEVFPGVSPKTRSILNGIAASHRANDRNVALAPTIPANFGTHTIDTAANFLQRKQLVVTVPQFPNINGLEPWEAAICRGLIAATGSHDNRELPWFLEVMTKTYYELGDPSVDGRLMMLDTPLATALPKTLPMQLRTRVAQL